MLINTRILRLNKAGVPLQWLDREQAATLLVKGLVLWSLGDTTLTIRGGHNRQGLRSVGPPALLSCCLDLRKKFYALEAHREVPEILRSGLYLDSRP